MLTSSDAKLRCLYYMVVWSFLLMFISQFFRLTDHIVFYIFAAAAMLVLPFVTSMYSTTAGRRGSGLLRVSYIFCDPVLACISVIPTLLLSHLPRHSDDYICLQPPAVTDNTTLFGAACFNRSVRSNGQLFLVSELSDVSRVQLRSKLLMHMTLIQLSLLFPPLLTLSMGRRTRKMSLATAIIIGCYWLIVAIETIELLSVDLINITMASRRSSLTNTVAIVSIAMILANSYAIVTLCSYICPADRDEDPLNSTRGTDWFNVLYRCLVSGAGILFAEVPLLAAHIQVLMASDVPSVTSVAWTIKDVVFILVAVVSAIYYTVGSGRNTMGASCGRLAFDNPDVFFLPEKRDAYIVRHQHISRSIIATVTEDDEPDAASADVDPSGLLQHNDNTNKKKKRVKFRFDLHSHRGRHSSGGGDSVSEKGDESTEKVVPLADSEV